MAPALAGQHSHAYLDTFLRWVLKNMSEIADIYYGGERFRSK